VHGEAGGVVAAILEPTEPLDEERSAFFLADVPNDSAHDLVSPV
jgi:hypothetical protein